jgi:hypothetical protein
VTCSATRSALARRPLDWFARRDQLLLADGVGTSEEVFSRLLAGLWPRIPADRIAQLAGVSEPVPTGPAAADAEDLSASAVEVVIEVPRGSWNKYEFDHCHGARYRRSLPAESGG